MIRVLTKTLSSSYHVEYYSYALFIILQKEFLNLSQERLKYVGAKSSSEICHIDIGGHKISFIDIGENKYGWKIDEEVFESMDFETIKSKATEIAKSINNDTI